jgi:O-antigen/teichoic acid export membrane protein
MNETTSRTVAKNASVLMASQLLTWGLTLLLTVFLPRYLGAEAIGQLHLAGSLWAMVMVFIAFGMDIVLIKEIARDSSRMPEHLSTSIVLRAIFFVVGFLAVFIYVTNVDYSPETVLVVVIIGISDLFAQVLSACGAVLQGFQRMEYKAIGDVAGKAFGTIASIILVLLGQGVLVIAAVNIGAVLVTMVIYLYFVNRTQKLCLWCFTMDSARWLLRSGVPFLLTGIFLVIYVQIDVIIISLVANETVVGWYSAADRLFGTLLFIPTVFITAIFPVLSQAYANDPDSLPKIMRKSFDLLLLLSVPIGLGVLVVANGVVLLLFGEGFINSGPVLAVMGIVLLLTYQNMLVGQFLISIDKQNMWTWVMAVATFVSLPLDLILVPWCQATFNNGAIGGALAFVITESGMMIAGLRLMPRNTLTRQTAQYAFKVFLSGGVMVAATWWMRDFFVVIPIVVGAVVFLAMILLLKVVPQEDWALFRSLFMSVLARLGIRKVQPVP